MNESSRSLRELLNAYPACVPGEAEQLLQQARQGFIEKIVVLDDDPTGVQTVHDVPVYTDWDLESMLDAFRSPHQLFFVLTNSRGFIQEKTEEEHRKIALVLLEVSRQTTQRFVLISRGDSTLRGHYPLETNVLRQTIEAYSAIRFSGEVILPFFLEGGRYTADNVHYVANGDELVPAGQTEFARDQTFGYHSSNLCEWVAEKSRGLVRTEDVGWISLQQLREKRLEEISAILRKAENVQKIVVNALCEEDVKFFTAALLPVLKEGKHFLFRTAAAFPKVLGGIADRPLLTTKELCDEQNPNGGLVIAGSHVQKTTQQLAYLKKSTAVEFVELNQHLVLNNSAFLEEQHRVLQTTEELLKQGKNVVVQTRRERFDLKNGSCEDELRIAVKISDAVTGIVRNLTLRPSFMIAKGGITSSEIGTKGLGVKKAMVWGQILPGIPVWKIGEESKFPGLPYVIFPGNVGSESALADAVNKCSMR